MTSNLEKIYMNWVFKNPQFFKMVDSHFFENDGIGFVYSVVKNEYELSEIKELPTNKEILNLVQIADKENKIETGFVKSLLKIDFINDYREQFVVPRFKAWVLSNSSINGLIEAYEEIKLIDKTDLSQVEEKLANIKYILDTSFNVQLDKPSIGLDFDDPDAHNQNTEVNKIPTGYDCVDGMTDGGWDRKTLNILFGAPGSGKSLFLQNFAVNAVNQGFNVAYITLELSDKKCLKRIGSMRLNIPIAEYTELSRDTEFIKERIKSVNNDNGMFGQKPGKLFIQEYPSGSATLSDLERYIKLVKDETGISLDMLVIDYLQIMGTERNVDRNMLYLKGEHLAVGLRAIAQRHNLVALSATQTAKEKYGVNDAALNDIPESKAIADTADSAWGIIMTPPMKVEGKYHLKPVKLRDSATDFDRVGFNLNKKTLRIDSDHYISHVI
jgi:archaellum biogenesis ATPase FlaH